MSTLCLACEPCNLAKGTQDVRAFLAHDPARLERLLAQAKAPLKDATAVNATRWVLSARLQATGLPVEGGSGGRTKYNRSRPAVPKTHWLDAAAVGASTPERLDTAGVVPLLITATGRVHRRLCNVIAFAGSSDDRTAIVISQESGMRPHPHPAHKERPLLPGFKRPELPGRFLWRQPVTSDDTAGNRLVTTFERFFSLA